MFRRTALACLLALVFAIAGAASASATITMSSPVATLYDNAVFVNWSSTTSLSSLYMVWTCTGGLCFQTEPSGTTELSLAGVQSVTHASFSFNPSEAAKSSAFESGTPNLIDGTYSVHLRGVQPNGLTLASSTVTNVKTVTKTWPVEIKSPVNGSTYNTLPVSLAFGSSPSLSRAIELDITNLQTSTVSELDLASKAQSQSFSLNPSELAEGGHVTSVSGPTSLSDGSYRVSATYADQYSHEAVSATVAEWTLKRTTDAPVVTEPVNGSIDNTLPISFTLPEAPGANTIALTLTNLSTSETSILRPVSSSRSQSFTLNPAALTEGGHVTVVSGAAALVDGSYSVAVTYQDELLNPSATATIAEWTLKRTTVAPIVTAPVLESTTNTLPIAFSLTEEPAPGSVELSLTNAATGKTTVLKASSNNREQSFALSPQNLTQGANVTYVSGPAALADGTYSVAVSYEDSLLNPTATTTISSWTLKTATSPPTLALPQTASTTNTLPVSFVLAEAPRPGSVQLTLRNLATSETTTLTLTASELTESFQLNPAELGQSPEVASVSGPSSLADGSYSVSLSYRDTLGDPAATATSSNWTLKRTTAAPIVQEPLTGSVASALPVSFTLPEAPDPGTIELTLTPVGTGESSVLAVTSDKAEQVFQLNPAQLLEGGRVSSLSGPTTLADGTYNVSVSYIDALLNPRASVTVAEWNLRRTTSPPTISQPTEDETTNQLPVSFALAEAAAAGSIYLSLDNTTTGETSLLSVSSDAREQSFTLNPASLLQGGHVSSRSGPTALSDGTYNVTVGYRDDLLNPDAATTVKRWVLKRTTSPAELTAPSEGGSGNSLPVSFDLGETPSAGSIYLTLTNLGNSEATVLKLSSAAASQQFYLDPSDLTDGTNVTLVSGPTALTDATYSVSLSYQDALLNPAATTTVAKWTLRRLTAAPSILSPTQGATTKALALSYTLPEAPLGGSVQLKLTNLATSTVTTLALTGSGTSESFTLDPAELLGGGHVSSVSGPAQLGEGTYSVALSYRDALGNETATSTISEWTLKQSTAAPALIISGGPEGQPVALAYTLPEAALPGSVTLTLSGPASAILELEATGSGSHAMTLTPADLAASTGVTSVSHAAVLPAGSYEATLEYRDLLGNPAAQAHAGVTISPARTTTIEPAPITGTSMTGMSTSGTATSGASIGAKPSASTAARFAIEHAWRSSSGRLLVRLAVPGPGTIFLKPSADFVGMRGKALAAKVITLSLPPTARGRRLIARDRHHAKALSIRLRATFTPRKGGPQVKSVLAHILAARRHRRGAGRPRGKL